ncbi:MAG: hypothetical protein ACLS5Y_09005 [Clostridia bacterium]
MMNDIVKIKMEMEIKGNEIDLNFGMAIQEQINKDLTKEEREEIGRLSVEISKIVGKAVRRKIDEEMERDERIDDLFEKTKDELYEHLSEGDKKKVDEFRKKLDNCKTLEDALLLAMEELENELK